MESWSRLVVLLLTVVVLVHATPLLNEKKPDEEWPSRNSVKQPSDEVQNADLTIPDEPQGEVPNEPIKVEKDKEIEEVDEYIPKAIAGIKANEEKVDYSGAQVWKLKAEDRNARRTIRGLVRRNLVSSWGGNQSYVDILVKSDTKSNVSSVLEKSSISYDIIIEDLQKRIEEENPPLDANELELQDRQGHRMTWKKYHRLEDIHGFMDYLAKTYPNIVSVKSIGKSFEKRDIKLLRISDGKPTNKAVFIDGGIHAREWISPATVTYFINQFAENFDEESNDIKNIDWYFVPVLNPDGYEYTHLINRLWRKNRKPSSNLSCFGTDLNRNFGYHWGEQGASNRPCSETYRGRRAFSEPEAKAMSDFIQSSAAKFSAYLSYHSYGQYILYPWGYGNVLPPDYQDLQNLGEKMAEAMKQTGGSEYSVGSSSGLLYPAAGGSDDWAKAQNIKYAYTVELPDRGTYGFILPASYIEPVAKESLAGLRVLASQINSN